jgi:hypothetical protein
VPGWHQYMSIWTPSKMFRFFSLLPRKHYLILMNRPESLIQDPNVQHFLAYFSASLFNMKIWTLDLKRIGSVILLCLIGCNIYQFNVIIFSKLWVLLSSFDVISKHFQGPTFDDVDSGAHLQSLELRRYLAHKYEKQGTTFEESTVICINGSHPFSFIACPVTPEHYSATVEKHGLDGKKVFTSIKQSWISMINVCERSLFVSSMQPLWTR